MKDKRILFVSSEVVPYLPETELSSTAFNVAKNAHSKGVQTRIFTPRFGVINERRHQLHEVIRLSGMNLGANIWWRRRELNPRPPARCLRLYMLSSVFNFSTL